MSFAKQALSYKSNRNVDGRRSCTRDARDIDAMSVSKFGIPLKKHGYDAKRERLRPAIESLRNYVRVNALCLGSSVDYDARERKIRRLASPEEDTDATSKSYVELALRAAREDEIGYRESVERITSQLRKDTNEVRQTTVLLFTRLTQLDNAMSKQISVVESNVSKIETNENVLRKRIDAVENSISKIVASANALNKRIDAAKNTL